MQHRAEAYFTGNPVVVCGTAGPGVTHLFNGLVDATRDGAPVIAITGDVERSLIDTQALEELNPYRFFDTACLYVGRVVDPQQARAVINAAILTAVVEKGSTVISLPGDVASADAPSGAYQVATPCCTPVLRPADWDIERLAGMIEKAKTVAILGGDGCRDARDEVLALAVGGSLTWPCSRQSVEVDCWRLTGKREVIWRQPENLNPQSPQLSAWRLSFFDRCYWELSRTAADTALPRSEIPSNRLTD
jgi:hypothetical protein